MPILLKLRFLRFAQEAEADVLFPQKLQYSPERRVTDRIGSAEVKVRCSSVQQAEVQAVIDRVLQPFLCHADLVGANIQFKRKELVRLGKR